jgi:hypothetical protein
LNHNSFHPATFGLIPPLCLQANLCQATAIAVNGTRELSANRNKSNVGYKKAGHLRILNEHSFSQYLLIFTEFFPANHRRQRTFCILWKLHYSRDGTKPPFAFNFYVPISGISYFLFVGKITCQIKLKRRAILAEVQTISEIDITFVPVRAALACRVPGQRESTEQQGI